MGGRDQRQLECVEVVVTCAAVGELELKVDGGEGLVAGARAEGLDGVDADLLVGNRDAALGGRAEYGEVPGKGVSAQA
jgi:hypothetical protein